MQDIKRLDWQKINNDLNELGYSVTEPLLTTNECSDLIGLYTHDSIFRSRIQMEKFRFGAGEYKYFAYPLPTIVQKLREEIYPHLVSTANRWMNDLGMKQEYPDSLEQFLERCHRSGQKRPTPLMLTYKQNDYNCLHQDLYGQEFFPIQGTCMLSRPNEDFRGGEFLLVEQRPRAQSVGHVVSIPHGGFVFFATSFRPVRGTRGAYRVTMRHGVSRIHSGSRFTLGIIFHDAK
ncbi:2OG-Fe(II) oxygenase [bacterium]|nr:2OG-Fe(II) oxygenase [bacterium]